MRWNLVRRPGFAAALLAVGIFGIGFQDLRGQGVTEQEPEVIQNLTYLRGQTVLPVYEGWHPNDDGTFDIWFGYLNQNWQEQPVIPIGPDNNISAPYGPDGGQPTHFLNRVNHWVFAVRVPKDFGQKEVVWTLRSHGQTRRAYGTLNPGYIRDDMGMVREYGGPSPADPEKILTFGDIRSSGVVLRVDGDNQRNAKVGQTITLSAVATQDVPPEPTVSRYLLRRRLGSGRTVARGLRLAWFVYRGPDVTFDPPQWTVWEDPRGGTPWSADWVNPPIPPDNRWIVRASFSEPGEYVLRCLATDGRFMRTEDIAVTVTR